MELISVLSTVTKNPNRPRGEEEEDARQQQKPGAFEKTSKAQRKSTSKINRNKRGNIVELKKQRQSSGASRQVSKRQQSPASTDKAPRMSHPKLLGIADRSQTVATPKLSYRTDRPSPAPERYIPPVVPASWMERLSWTRREQTLMPSISGRNRNGLRFTFRITATQMKWAE
ncbi:hypothetical protein ACHAPF_010443 [Botrytis cinerea]